MLGPASKLHDVHKNLAPQPLKEPDEFRAFYRDRVNFARGGDRIARMKLGLERAHGGVYYKSVLMGHPGVGKSTELTRLAFEVNAKFEVIRLAIGAEFDPVNFKPFDLLLLMMAELVERTARPPGGLAGGAGREPDEHLLEAILDWFARETTTCQRMAQVGAGVEAGAGIEAGSLFTRVLGLFARIKGEVKYSADRKVEIVEYRLQRVSELADLVNRLLDACLGLLRERTGKEWLFIIEDFEKFENLPQALEAVKVLLVDYANLLKELHAHIILTAPVAFRYSSAGLQLPFSYHLIPDTPVFHPDHQLHQEGRAAIREALDARVAPSLLAEGQADRLIVGSGGNLRDLFWMVQLAADEAILAGSPFVREADASTAINALRTEYKRRLATSPFDEPQITYTEKTERLLKIYRREPDSEIGDRVLDALLRARCVQEFNDSGWFGLPPLVVDILKSQDVLRRDDPGGVE